MWGSCLKNYNQKAFLFGSPPHTPENSLALLLAWREITSQIANKSKRIPETRKTGFGTMASFKVKVLFVHFFLCFPFNCIFKFEVAVILYWVWEESELEAYITKWATLTERQELATISWQTWKKNLQVIFALLPLNMGLKGWKFFAPSPLPFWVSLESSLVYTWVLCLLFFFMKFMD